MAATAPLQFVEGRLVVGVVTRYDAELQTRPVIVTVVSFWPFFQPVYESGVTVGLVSPYVTVKLRAVTTIGALLIVTRPVAYVNE